MAVLANNNKKKSLDNVEEVLLTGWVTVSLLEYQHIFHM